MEFADDSPLQFSEDRSEPVDRFNPLTSTKVALFQLFLSLGLGVFGAFLHVFHNTFIKPCDLIMAILLAQVTFWILNVILDHYYKWRHNYLRLSGYFRLYTNISRSSSMMLANVSLFNAFFIVLFAVMLMGKPEYPNFCQNRGKDSAYFLLGLLVMIESLLSIFFIVKYLVHVCKFNKEKPITDIDELEHRLFFPEDYGVGYRYPGESYTDLLKKYTHLLFYYKAANRELRAKVLFYSVHRPSV